MNAPFLHDHEGALVAWFRRYRRALDLATLAVVLLVVLLFAGQLVRWAVR